jgi:HD superfamily phosphohydrolase
MKIYDTLYGDFEIPKFLIRFIEAPEFKRLNEVRLININSPSLAALSDVRRYSHTLGALHLAMSNPLETFGEEEYKALLSAMVVHDAGTPAFAHLFEYLLKDKFNWDHESVVPRILRTEHHPDGGAHQIYAAQIPKFKKLCDSANVDFDLVVSILERCHPASSLVFGTLDFDNIDNVARMSWMLGHRFDPSALVSLASMIGVGPVGNLLLPEHQRDNLELWAKLRRSSYQVLAFDGPTVAGQAVLSSAIAAALEDQTLSIDDWVYTDVELIDIIRKNSACGRSILNRDFFGELPRCQMVLHITNEENELNRLDRAQLSQFIAEFLRTNLNIRRPYGYVFHDRGTFSKHVEATDPITGRSWAIGGKSRSLILHGFGDSSAPQCPEAMGREFASWMAAKL